MERVFDIALTLHADHELNASTFAARVTAATLSDIYSAATSAIGALKGPLHGGANEEVIRMLLEAGDERNAIAARRGHAGATRRRFRASDIACTAPRIRAPRICARCQRSSATAPDTSICITPRRKSKN